MMSMNFSAGVVLFRVRWIVRTEVTLVERGSHLLPFQEPIVARSRFETTEKKYGAQKFVQALRRDDFALLDDHPSTFFVRTHARASLEEEEGCCRLLVKRKTHWMNQKGRT